MYAVPGKEGMSRDNVRVISVTSGKGGVGKTNITVNLACLLSKMKKKILILDADMLKDSAFSLLTLTLPCLIASAMRRRGPIPASVRAFSNGFSMIKV